MYEETIPPVAKIAVYVSEPATSRPFASRSLTVIVAFSPGAYEDLSSETLTAAGVDDPTRTDTAAASTPVVAVAEAFVVTVTLAVPAAIPVSGTRYSPVVAEYVAAADV